MQVHHITALYQEKKITLVLLMKRCHFTIPVKVKNANVDIEVLVAQYIVTETCLLILIYIMNVFFMLHSSFPSSCMCTACFFIQTNYMSFTWK